MGAAEADPAQGSGDDMMIKHSKRNDAPATVHAAVSAVALAVCALALTACSGGGSGPSLGSGQGPDPATVDFALAYVKRTIPADPMAMQLRTAPRSCAPSMWTPTSI